MSGDVELGYIRGEGREERYLLPETSDANLGEEKLVRFLDLFAEKLDRVELDIRRRQARFGSSSANLYNS